MVLEDVVLKMSQQTISGMFLEFRLFAECLALYFFVKAVMSQTKSISFGSFY